MREELIVHHRIFEEGDIIDTSMCKFKEGYDPSEFGRCLVLHSFYNALDQCFNYTILSSKHEVYSGKENDLKLAQYRGHVDLSTVFDTSSSPLAIRDEYSDQTIVDFDKEENDERS